MEEGLPEDWSHQKRLHKAGSLTGPLEDGQNKERTRKHHPKKWRQCDQGSKGGWNRFWPVFDQCGHWSKQQVGKFAKSTKNNFYSWMFKDLFKSFIELQFIRDTIHSSKWYSSMVFSSLSCVTIITIYFRTFSSPSKETLYPYQESLPIPHQPPQLHISTNLLSVSVWIYIFWTFHINGIFYGVNGALLPNPYAEVLTPSISECDLIWK